MMTNLGYLVFRGVDESTVSLHLIFYELLEKVNECYAV
jgi:hypothetical protein